MESLYDRALSEVGQDGYFQKKFDFIYNVILNVLWSAAYMNIVLALEVPVHHCQLPENVDNNSDITWKLKHIPKYEDVNGKSKFDSCLMYLNDSNKTIECDQYDYNKTWFETTIPSEFNWVCDKEIYVANVYAYSRIGDIIGSLFFGWFGDIYGRRLTYIVSLLLIVIGRIVSIIANQSYLLFVSGCVIACLPSWSAVQSTNVISIEISSPSRRTTTATLRLVSFSAGVCVMSLLYWWLREWRLLFIVNTASLMPFLLFSWKIIESPRWLLLKGNTKGCVKQLKQIAKSNGSTLEEDTEKDFFTTPVTGKTEIFGFLTLFSSSKLALNSTLQLILWATSSLTYTVLLMSVGQNKNGNPFLELILQTVVAEIPGSFIGAWLADRFGRRYTSIGAYNLAAVVWIVSAWLEGNTGFWSEYWWVTTLLSITARLAITITYYTINLFNMEIYPTCLRQSGMSLGNVVSCGSSALAPYVTFIGRRFDSRLPALILLGASVIGIISSYLLPETLNEKLPETLEDAQNYGRRSQNQNYAYILKDTSSHRSKRNE